MLFKIMAGVAAAAVGVAVWQTLRIENLQARGVENQIELAACGARLNNLIEDLESDNAIDQLPDSALTDVPDEWLRPVQPGD